VACFTRAFGSAFLGEPRTECVEHAHDPGWRMLLPMWILVYFCLLIGTSVGPLAAYNSPAWSAAWPGKTPEIAFAVASCLSCVSLWAGAFVVLCLLLAGFRLLLLRGRSVRQAVTWDCGYAAPAARMQYTASSFAQPLADMFRTVLHTKVSGGATADVFPGLSQSSSVTADAVRAGFYQPLFSGVLRGVIAVRRLQHGNLHLYVLYIALTLLFLLFMELG
jgi:NADH:ubiquinone oxidoreductase subunit 5 (subunit L)/multisubunit Na+/H+ antiporter MnhA subunit